VELVQNKVFECILIFYRRCAQHGSGSLLCNV